jgi:hypothetical protein
VALAVFTSRNNRLPSPTASATLVPAFDLNAVEQIEVAGNTQTAKVVRTGNGWVVPAKHNYPAKFEKVREVVLSISQLKSGQKVRVTEEQKKAMKIAGPGDDGGRLVSVRGAGGKQLASLILGITHDAKPAAGGPMEMGYPDGRYISADGGKTVYLVSEVLNDIPDNDSVWVDSELMSVSGQDIRDIRISGEGRDDVHLSRTNRTDKMALDAQAPEGKETDTSGIYGVESALSYLRFNDVADPSADAAPFGMSTATVFRAETFQGEVYSVRIGCATGGSDERYARFEVSLLPASEEEPTASTNSADKAAVEAKAKERKDLESRVATLNKKVAGWTYVIPSYNAGSMTKTLQGLFKDKEKPAEEKTDIDASAREGNASEPNGGAVAAVPEAEKTGGNE